MSSANQETLAAYRDKGLAGKMGFGSSPAIVVVDFLLGFTRQDSPLGSDLDREIEASRRLLDAGRAAGIPILYSITAYSEGLQDGGTFVRKVPSLGVLLRGSELVQIDPRLDRRPEETTFEKKYASAFFGTSLASELTAHGVDTVIVCGATTSGCVRATVVDAMQHGFRPIVPEQCVGDRSAAAHRANLTDIEGKYGDVVDVEVVIDYLSGLGRPGMAGS
ncbi:MAG: isochorismatase family protein [Acidobacteriota bacterium]